MTATLHIENKVHDYDSWKLVFDKFDRMRADGGVLRHRVSRDFDDPSAVVIDLDFETVEAAVAYRERLQKIWATPQSQGELASHEAPVIRRLVEERRVPVGLSD